MKQMYSVSSQELSDKILLAYENLISIIGYNNAGSVYSGIYDEIEVSGVNLMLSSSGIPHIGIEDQGLSNYFSTQDLVEYLKFDYIYRKAWGEISYMELKNG